MQKGEADVASRELVGVDFPVEATTGVIGAIGAAKVGHQLLVVPRAITVF